MKRDLMIPKVTFRVRTGDEVETDGGCAIGGQWLNKTTEDFFKGRTNPNLERSESQGLG